MGLISKIRKSVRKENLKEELENLVKTDKKVAEYLENEFVRRKDWAGYRNYTKEEVLAQVIDLHLGSCAIVYVWNVVSAVISTYGIKSAEFKYGAKKLLSRKEKRLMKKNVLKTGFEKAGSQAREGISEVENRSYNIKENIRLFEEAKEIYDELIKGKSDFLFRGEGDRLDVESNPLYKYYQEK